MPDIFLPFIALCLYVLFVGVCFCDGFNLSVPKKIVWYIVLLVMGIYSLQTRDQFDLAIILPLPTLVALAICWLEKKKNK